MTVYLEWAGVTVPVSFKDGEVQIYDAYRDLTNEVCRRTGLKANLVLGQIEGEDAGQASTLGADIICLARPMGGEAGERKAVAQAITDLHQTLVMQNTKVARVKNGKIVTWEELTNASLEKVAASSPGSKTAAFALREIARRQGKLASA